MKFKKIIYSIILSVSSFVYAEEASRFATESEASVVSASQVAISQEIDDEISRIWKDSSFLFNDTVLLPSADNNGVNIHTNLRRQPEILKKARISIQTAKIVSLPEPKPMLTRRQILQQEINKEKNALMSVQNQLLAAQKARNEAAIRKLSVQISDRVQNMRALMQEMRR